MLPQIKNLVNICSITQRLLEPIVQRTLVKYKDYRIQKCNNSKLGLNFTETNQKISWQSRLFGRVKPLQFQDSFLSTFFYNF